jgi:hypothetical protein
LSALTETFENLNGTVDLRFKLLKKYCKFIPDLFSSLLLLIIKLNFDGNKIIISQDDFINNIDFFNDINIIKNIIFKF